MRISVYVADVANGVPVDGLPARLARWRPNGWRPVWAGRTGLGGRVSDLAVPDHQGAMFEFVLDTDCYYTTLGRAPFFDKVRVVFTGGDGERAISIVLGPQSYLVCAFVPPAPTDALSSIDVRDSGATGQWWAPDSRRP